MLRFSPPCRFQWFRCRATATANPPPVAPRNRAGQLMLKSLTLPELEAWCLSAEGEGEDRARRRAQHLWRWMYYDAKDGACWVRSLDDTAGRQNSIAAGFRDAVRDEVTLDGGLNLLDVATAADGTRKLVFALTEGPAAGKTIETVLIPVAGGRKPRITACVSSQVGCAMNCQFCYTGRMGLAASLSTAQIVEQVVEARRYLSQQGDPVPITNIVYMGMGEPLDALDSVLASLAILTHPNGMQFSAAKVTVSTVGLVPAIHSFVAASPAQLAVSLHATTDEVRDWIAPVNRRHDLAELMGCLAVLFPAAATAGRHGRHVLFEYVMLRDINDSGEDAARLLALTAGIECKVNLIVFNPHTGTRFLPSEMETVLAFRRVLVDGGMVCTVRDSRGDEEMAACGQLGTPAEEGAPAGRILTPPPRFAEVLDRQQAALRA